MRKKFSLFLFLLIVSNDIVFGKHRNRTRDKTDQRKPGALNNKTNSIRLKRSLNDDKIIPQGNLEKQKLYSDPKLDKEPPFWGTRGRRESSEELDVNWPSSKYLIYNGNTHKTREPNYNFRHEDEEESPFWGNRGRRNSAELEEIMFNSDIPFKDRRQDDEPLSGTRGRRQNFEDNGFENHVLNMDQESEPYWGNTGRRDEEPFWGSRGKKKQNQANLNEETIPFWGNRGRRRLQLKEPIIKAISNVNNDLNDLVEQRHGEEVFRGPKRGNRLRYLPNLLNISPMNKLTGNDLVAKKSDDNTVHDDRIYAEEPHYIIVERSSRSSAEFDPFYISRGKKYIKFDISKTMPSRRGAIEDLVKSVRNDPYYIARGKKDSENSNFTIDDVGLNAKNVFCSTIDELINKNKVKRDVTKSNDRGRRTILKNLAQKLQMDPYYVSRGKKYIKDMINDDDSFVDRITALCH